MSGRSAEPVSQNPFFFGAESTGPETPILSLGAEEVAAVDVRETAEGLSSSSTTENFANFNEVDQRATDLSQQAPLNLDMDHSSANNNNNNNNNATSGNRAQEAEFSAMGFYYVEFLREEIRTEGLEEPERFRQRFPLRNEPTPTATTTGDEERPNLAIGYAEGMRLRQFADSFASSQERQLIHDQAERVDLTQLNLGEFINLLRGLFEDRNNRPENVMVLFFYCRDLAIRALRTHLERQFNDLLNWSVTYIFQWINARGGWERVWSSCIGHSSSTTITLAVLGIACLVLAIYNFRRTA